MQEKLPVTSDSQELLIRKAFGGWTDILIEAGIAKYRKMLFTCELNNIPIEPASGKVFHCFKACPKEKLCWVILGQDPYPQEGVATGLAFGNDVTRDGFKDISPSLKVIRNSVLSLYDSDKNAIFDESLESWANQGILLLNSALTVRRGIPGSHQQAWRPFIEKVIKGILKDNPQCCFLLLGAQAQIFIPIIQRAKGAYFTAPHPAKFVREGKDMPPRVWKDCLEYVRLTFGRELKLWSEL